MTASPLENKAHELLGQLKPGKLAAVVHLLEVMVHDEDIEDGDTLRHCDLKIAERPPKGIHSYYRYLGLECGFWAC